MGSIGRKGLHWLPRYQVPSYLVAVPSELVNRDADVFVADRGKAVCRLPDFVLVPGRVTQNDARFDENVEALILIYPSLLYIHE